MKNKQVARILEEHNEWRKGNRPSDAQYCPSQLSTALDLAVIELKYSLRVSDVLAIVDGMSEFDSLEERESFMKDLEQNLNGI